MISAYLQGLLTSLGLLAGIGAQNLFVLRAGLHGRCVLPVALTSSLCDAFLIILGAVAFGELFAIEQWVARILGLAATLFMLHQGAAALRAAWRPKPAEDTGAAPRGLAPARAVAAAIAFSLLNPQVWVDTVVFLGGIACQMSRVDRFAFATGATSASVAWFFGLSFGARRVAPVLVRPSVARVLDAVVGTSLITLAGVVFVDVLAPGGVE